MLGTFALVGCGAPLSIRRAARHPVPVIDLSLFAMPAFGLANLAMVLFTAAFYGGLLGHVLFLTTTWRYSLVQAGLALTPAPVCATVAGAAAAHLAARYGHRAVILPSLGCFAAGMLLLHLDLGASPAFAREWLLPNMLLGSGVGLALPTLSSASVAALPAAKLAMGSAMGNTARQFGAVLGVVLLIAVLGVPTSLPALVSAFQRVYGLFMGMAVVSGMVCLALGCHASEQHLMVVCWLRVRENIQVDSVALPEMVKQHAQRRWWGRGGPAAPVAPEHDPGLQPRPHRA